MSPIRMVQVEHKEDTNCPQIEASPPPSPARFMTIVVFWHAAGFNAGSRVDEEIEIGGDGSCVDGCLPGCGCR